MKWIKLIFKLYVYQNFNSFHLDNALLIMTNYYCLSECIFYINEDANLQRSMS